MAAEAPDNATESLVVLATCSPISGSRVEAGEAEVVSLGHVEEHREAELGEEVARGLDAIDEAGRGWRGRL
jgi:hypothetical protein